MPITITDLALAPVKGMRVVAVDALQLAAHGAAGDRELVVVDADDSLLITERHPALTQVAPAWDPDSGRLALRFPDGTLVEEVVEPGEPVSTRNYQGRSLAGRRVDGAPAAALSEHLGRAVTLVRLDPGVQGPDDAPVTLMSTASLEALAPALGEVPDPRRFRMTLTVDGVGAWEEHSWAGRELAAGDALLRVLDPIPRCVVTTRDPDRGTRDLPVLKALATLRGKKGVEFGMWCAVAAPGTVRRGDGVELR